MNTLENIIQTNLTDAMKNHQENAVNALRSVKAAILNEKTNGKFHELTDNDIVKLIQKLVKQRQESMEIYSAAERNELAEKEQKEMFVLMNYLPKMLSENEIKSVIDELFTEMNIQSMKDMGRLMKVLGEKYPNQYDGKIASNYIKSK